MDPLFTLVSFRDGIDRPIASWKGFTTPQFLRLQRFLDDPASLDALISRESEPERCKPAGLAPIPQYRGPGRPGKPVQILDIEHARFEAYFGTRANEVGIMPGDVFPSVGALADALNSLISSAPPGAQGHNRQIWPTNIATSLRNAAKRPEGHRNTITYGLQLAYAEEVKGV
jgi:hypothetical protein